MSGQSQQFTPSVAGTSNTGVTWSLSPAVGSLTSFGLYTAPSPVASSQVVTITACSKLNASACASAYVTLIPPPAIYAGGIGPSVIHVGTSGYVEIYGTNLAINGQASTSISCANVAWAPSYISASQMNVQYTVAPNATPGTCSVTITTTAGSSSQPITIARN